MENGMAKLRVGIIGAGNIAGFMAEALNGLGGEIEAYAVASRSLEKAQAFADKWHFKKAYGSYEELAGDEEIDLVYIATPHSEHYENAKLCLKHGRNLLVEKAFTANAGQAKEILDLAQEKGLLITEAIWTRYMPSRKIITDILASGELGEVTRIEAEFSVPISHKERMYDPALCGGALLDLGMYTLTAASICFGDDIVQTESTCEKYETGVDAADTITLTYRDGKMAKLRTSMIDGPVNRAKVTGKKAILTWENLNNPSEVKVCAPDGTLLRNVELPEQINGYEYEVLACKQAIENGQTECAEMPHEETLFIMKQMDDLRKAWGVRYPFE